jgi:GNAT superfamily N-acetyltransferase
MELRRAVEPDRPVLAVLAAGQQRRPERHIAYLGDDADVIAAEMVEEDEDWTAVSAVAEHGGRPIGWLMGSVDPEMGRVWWFGPFADVDDDRWPSVAGALYEHARRLLPSSVDEEELGPDSRHVALIEWAQARGFDVDPGSAVLTLTGVIEGPSIAVRPVVPGDADVVRLHDELFPGTHTTGAALMAGADDRHVRLVAEVDGSFVGYVAVELQPDGGGYVDYLGVEPSARRRGYGAELVRAGVAALREIGAGDVHLTVREANEGARALYVGLGFDEQRIIVPLRKGFRLQ